MWFAEELLALHRGQGLDIYWRDNMKCPTEQEYSDMVVASMFLMRSAFVSDTLTRHIRDWRLVQIGSAHNAII